MYFKKELDTDFSLLTKACQFSLVQSTKAGTTPCPPCHCLHTMTYSVPVVLIEKLLQYNHWQGCGDKHHHIVGSYPQNHPYCTILYKCVHIMHDSNLAGTSSQSWSTILSIYSLYNVPQFSTLPNILQDQVVTNTVPVRMTLAACSYLHYPHNTIDRAKCHLSGILLPCWHSIQE